MAWYNPLTWFKSNPISKIEDAVAKLVSSLTSRSMAILEISKVLINIRAKARSGDVCGSADELLNVISTTRKSLSLLSGEVKDLSRYPVVSGLSEPLDKTIKSLSDILQATEEVVTVLKGNICKQ